MSRQQSSIVDCEFQTDIFSEMMQWTQNPNHYISPSPLEPATTTSPANITTATSYHQSTTSELLKLCSSRALIISG
ncbi:hypothetical protein QVD17_06456 [Tagetes erecta]|uniref:Uncharacterized protein n=1 Tax=Tagetes erecta TaxID=13708 RepID=A0AAD8PC87_TARER|nr:hypothetical protein QVD17_06456 [Tagetes erecta]